MRFGFLEDKALGNYGLSNFFTMSWKKGVYAHKIPAAFNFTK